MTAPAAASRLGEPVVRQMRTDVPRLAPDQTVGAALAAVRSAPPAGRIVYFYVLGPDDRLEGVVPTRRLLLSPDTTPIRDIMVTRVVAIPASATVLEACEFFLLHRLLALPVVDDRRRMLGIVDVDLSTDELVDIDRREQLDDLFQLIGVHVEDFQPPAPWRAFQSRFPWLLANIAGGIVAAFLTGLFQAELERAVTLALFVPVVLALAESVAIQSLSIALQRLQGRRPTPAGILRAVRHEAVAGLLLGTASAVIVALVALIWLGQSSVAAAVLGGIAG
ncbi:MAG: magnesium transporter, partial [Planctomycetes bacterium]|nr:magnesium transporter [Planctomycetota bacterium]